MAALPPMSQALAALLACGKRRLFVTNNSSKSRQQYLAKFASLGIEVEPEEIVPSSYAAAAYLQSIAFRGTVFLVGGSGMSQELEAAGIRYLTLPLQQQPWTVDSLKELQLAEGIGAVVVGFDEHFTYEKLCYASVCLREVEGCHFVATNLDHADNIGKYMGGSWETLAAWAAA